MWGPGSPQPWKITFMLDEQDTRPRGLFFPYKEHLHPIHSPGAEPGLRSSLGSPTHSGPAPGRLFCPYLKILCPSRSWSPLNLRGAPQPSPHPRPSSACRLRPPKHKGIVLFACSGSGAGSRRPTHPGRPRPLGGWLAPPCVPRQALCTLAAPITAPMVLDPWRKALQAAQVDPQGSQLLQWLPTSPAFLA